MQLAMLRVCALPARLGATRSATQQFSRALRSAPVVLRATRAQTNRDRSQSDLQVAQPGQSLRVPSGALSSPFRMGSLFRDLEREIDDLVRGFGMPSFGELATPSAARSMAVDIEDKGDAFVVRADVPGVTKEDVKITVSPDNVLTISGERKSETKEEEGGVVRMERTFGSFMRSFRLPENVKADSIKAEISNGELHVTLPKKEPTEKKHIEIPVQG